MSLRTARIAVLLASLVSAPCVADAQVVTSAAAPLMPSASPETGAALVTADWQSCFNAHGFTLSRVTPTSRVGIASSNVTACRWTIEGLEPGAYQVHLSTTSGMGGSATFTAPAGTVTMVRLALPTVQVSGRVVLNGDPVADAEVWFFGKAAAGMPHVITAPDGTYSATLDGPGEYTASLGAASLKRQSRSAKFSTGANTLDWMLVGGTLTIHVSNWDRLTDVHVTVATTASSDSSPVLKPGDPPVVVLQGTPFGTHEVSATQAPNRTSRKTITVSLTREHPRAEVTLDLGDSRSRLVLTDPDGRPVSGASFAQGGPVPHGLSPPPEEIEPGVYSLEGHVPGTPVRIRLGKGLTPVCRQVPFDDVMFVAARAGRRVQVQTARPGAQIISDWTIVDMEGSDCPVLLRDFAPTEIPGSAGGPSQFLFENFPFTDAVVLQIAGRRYDLVVSPEGVLVLPF